MLRSHGHLHGVENGTFGLLFHIGRAAIPELGKVTGGVVHGGGIAVALLPFVAGGGGLVIDTVAVERVAGVTGNGLAPGEAGLVVEHAAERGLFRGGLLAGGLAGERGKCLQRGGVHGRRLGPTAGASERQGEQERGGPD